MTLKKYAIIFILFVSLFPVFYVAAETPKKVEPSTSGTSISKVKEAIMEKTPDFIINWITKTIEKLEEWRADPTINKLVFYCTFLTILIFILYFIWKKIL